MTHHEKAGTLKSNTNMWNDTYSYTNAWGKMLSCSIIREKTPFSGKNIPRIRLNLAK